MELSFADFFLSRRLRHHRALLDHPNSVVQDRSVYEDAEVFARNLYRQAAWASAISKAIESCTKC